MSLIQVGPVYINPEMLTGVSDVERVGGPDGATPSFSFSIFLEGSSTAAVSQNKEEIQALHDEVRDRINPGFRFHGGGVTLYAPAVNSIGQVTSEPTRANPDAGGFLVQMDGVTINLQYASCDKAEQGREALISAVNKA